MMENISQTCYLDIKATNYTRHLFSFEKSFDYWWAFYWLVDNWMLSLYFITFYLVAIFSGHQYMKSRPAYQLRVPLFLWNLSLALFSIVASTRLISQIVYMMQDTGFHSTICSAGTVEHKHAISIWIWLIVHSKVVELGDTAFIILRKTPLIFLHWYHHVSVLIFTWSSAAYPSAIQLYFAAVNAFVHSIMYSYYALKVLRVPVPRTVSMAITSVQLLQMVVGVYVTTYAQWAKSMDDSCCVFNKAITIAISVYVSYFVLFLNFFIRSYITKKPLFDGMGLLKKKLL